ncbi:hypothetical protein BLA29_015161, partial [Euroglyphus maynei]
VTTPLRAKEQQKKNKKKPP